MKLKRGIHRLYAEDPVSADRQLWGRKVDPVSRRGFLRGSGLAAMSAAVGASIPFAKFMPSGLIPAALAQSDEPFALPCKAGLTILNDRPINAETPAHLLDDKVTPAARLFVRNNGIPPAQVARPEQWTFEFAGESCLETKSLTVAELKANFEHHTLQLQIECGGNGRSEFYPPARGIQWTTGAIGCPEWTGARLRDVLEYCGIKDDAVYVAYEGADQHLSGDTGKRPARRSIFAVMPGRVTRALQKFLHRSTLARPGRWRKSKKQRTGLHGSTGRHPLIFRSPATTRSGRGRMRSTQQPGRIDLLREIKRNVVRPGSRYSAPLQLPVRKLRQL